MPVQKLIPYDEFERQQSAFMNQMKKQDLECLSCKNCGSQFFEQIFVSKFKADHNITLTQKIPVVPPGAESFKLLRCIYCRSITEPRVMPDRRDLMSGDYDKLLDTVEGKNDKRPKEQMEKANEFKIEKL